jgi:hypothetical protein
MNYLNKGYCSDECLEKSTYWKKIEEAKQYLEENPLTDKQIEMLDVLSDYDECLTYPYISNE